MSVLKHVVGHDEQELRHQPVKFNLDYLESDCVRQTEYAPQRRYRLKLEIYTDIWANQAQFYDAHRIGMRMLADEIYRDVAVHVRRAMFYCVNRDPEAAMEHLGLALKEMDPDEDRSV